MFIFGEQAADSPLLGFVHIKKCEPYICFSSGNPLAGRDIIGEGELSNQTLLVQDQLGDFPEFGDKRRRLVDANPGLRVKFVPDIDTIFLYLAGNQGIAISPFPFRGPDGGSGVVSVPFKDYHEQVYGMAFRRDDISKQQSDFIEILKVVRDCFKNKSCTE